MKNSDVKMIQSALWLIVANTAHSFAITFVASLAALVYIIIAILDRIQEN